MWPYIPDGTTRAARSRSSRSWAPISIPLMVICGPPLLVARPVLRPSGTVATSRRPPDAAGDAGVVVERGLVPRRRQVVALDDSPQLGVDPRGGRREAA